MAMLRGIHQGSSQKKYIYNSGNVHERNRTEAISMVKFSSYRYLAAFLTSPFKNEITEMKTRLWQVPRFDSYDPVDMCVIMTTV